VTERRLEYAARFFRRLEDIRERIAEDNPEAATRVVLRIRAAVQRLVMSPALGRPGRVIGTRELIIPGTPYIVPYRITGDIVQIITVLHSAQRWPEKLRDRRRTGNLGSRGKSGARSALREPRVERGDAFAIACDRKQLCLDPAAPRQFGAQPGIGGDRSDSLGNVVGVIGVDI